VDYSRQRTESFSEHYVIDLSLLKADAYDVKISGARIRTHDLWIRKRVCYLLHHSGDKPLIGPRCDVPCCGISTLSGACLQWFDTVRYLGVNSIRSQVILSQVYTLTLTLTFAP